MLPLTRNFIRISFMWITALTLIAGCSSEPVSNAPKKGYSFWPAAPDEPRIQFLTTFGSSGDIQEKQSSLDEAIYGKAEVLPIIMPYGVAMWHGKIYVCDLRNPGVIVLDLKGKVTRVMGTSGMATIGKAEDIAIAENGYKYVVDSARSSIVVFDDQDQMVATFSPKNFNPVSLAVSSKYIFVADFRGQVVKVLDRATGKEIRTIGEPGMDDGQFVRPKTVRLDKQGNVVVGDFLKARIMKFTQEGKFLMGVGQMGANPGDFNKIKHFAFDANGYMYVVDAAFNNVQVFDTDWKVVDYFGSPGKHPGAMDLPVGIFITEDPADVELFKDKVHPAFSPERLILVTNQGERNRVAVYAQGKLKKGKTVADTLPARAKVGTGLDDATQPTSRPAGPLDDLVTTPTTAPSNR